MMIKKNSVEIIGDEGGDSDMSLLFFDSSFFLQNDPSWSGTN